MHDLFLGFSVDKLRQFTERIDTCLSKLTEEQIWWRGADSQNAVGNLVLHLSGNVRQWIVCSIGDAPDERRRDEEFATRGGCSAQELRERLRSTVEVAAIVISSVQPHRLSEIIQVQNYNVTVLAAIYHVVEHFAQHTGQILYATKLMTADDLGFYKHLNRPGHGEKIP